MAKVISKTANAEVVKVKDAPKLGNYNNTSVDERKKSADFLLSQGRYVRFQNGVNGNFCGAVTEAKLKKLQSQFNWMTNY